MTILRRMQSTLTSATSNRRTDRPALAVIQVIRPKCRNATPTLTPTATWDDRCGHTTRLMRNASANPHCEGAMIAPPGSPAHSALPPEESAHHLAPGVVVNVRSRRYLVEDVTLPKNGDLTRVALACLDDDAQGSQLTVLWEREVDASILSAATWDDVASHGFDKPRQFSAYLHTLRWNCVTSTDAELFQAPYRAGIEVKAYQLEPLRKALAMPRVNLFIADDVGLGKTIEAGLIIR